jgi:hypothetical protein
MALGLRSRKRLKRRKIGLLKHSNALKSEESRKKAVFRQQVRVVDDD